MAAAFGVTSLVISCIVATAVLSFTTGFATAGGAVICGLPSGLPHFGLPDSLPWATLTKLVVPAMVISLNSFLETGSSAKVDQKLVSQP